LAKNWTGKERYDNSLEYLKTVDVALAAHVDRTIVGSKEKIGEGISLAGHKMYAMFGNTSVGRAVRALLLCHRAYLGHNWAMGTGNKGAGVPQDYFRADGDRLTKDKYLGKSEAVVRDAIKAYLSATPTPATSTNADAAELVGNGNSPAHPPYETLTREPTNFPSGQVCFNCVYWWLYKSGFVSLRWILRDGFKLGAENANQLLGDGTTLQLDSEFRAPAIPRGMVINWRGDQPDSRDICHWAVSLGNGNAIGANNSPGGRFNGKDVIVTFVSGGTAFGVFDINVMNKIYMGDKTYSTSAKKSGCVVATVDPSTVPDRNSGD